MFWPFAFSMASWHCVDENCGNVVSWEEAIYVEERGRLVGVRHSECSE